MALSRILVIEDEYLIAMLLEDTIKKAGCLCVRVCTSVESALACIERTEIDAAILNLMLKEQPAYEVCAALAVRGIPFAFASGVKPSEIEPLWRDRLFIEKPYSEDEVCNVLAKLLATPEQSIARLIDRMPRTAGRSV